MGDHSGVVIVERAWFCWGCAPRLFGTILKHIVLCCIGKFKFRSESCHEPGYWKEMGRLGKLRSVGNERILMESSGFVD